MIGIESNKNTLQNAFAEIPQIIFRFISFIYIVLVRLVVSRLVEKPGSEG